VHAPLVTSRVPAVLFGSHIAAYGAIRALGPGLHAPLFVVDDRPGLAARSRFVRAVLRLDPEDTACIPRLLDWVRRRVGKEAVFLVAGSDAFLDVLSAARDELPTGIHCTFPGRDLVAKVRCKHLTYEIAQAAGIGTPRTVFVQSHGELVSALSHWDAENYPVLLKPEASRRFLETYRLKGVICRSEDEALRAYETYGGFFGELLLQELIPGGDENLLNVLAAMNEKGEAIGVFVNRKVRTAGPLLSCTMMTSEWSEPVAREAITLLRAIGYYGYANPEFKLDPRDGRLKLMEINGRLTLSNSHALRCGIDLVGRTYLDAIGQGKTEWTEKVPSYPDGVLWWDPLGDIVGTLAHGSRGNPSALRMLWRSRRTGRIIEPFMWSDPAPASTYALRLFGAHLRASVSRSHRPLRTSRSSC